MKKLLIFLFLLLLPVPASAQLDENISDYQVSIAVQEDATINVSEKISYNFGELYRHGIFRIIPYRYKASFGKVTAPISNISVKQDGQTVDFSTSKSSGTLEIKIGDPIKTINGRHEYEINYTVSRSLGYFDDHDELYWNAVGTSWQVAVDKATAIVTLPKKVSGEKINTACYTGVLGSTLKNCSATVAENVITYKTTERLDATEGLTIVTGFPKGVVYEPTQRERFMQAALNNWFLIVPVTIFFIMLFIWKRHGKDAKGRGTVVPEYDPPKDLTPIEIGTLVDGRVDRKDISAEIIYLAERGYMTIKQIETKKLLVFSGTDYELVRTSKADDELSKISKEMLSAIFDGASTVALSDLKSTPSFSNRLREATSNVYSELVRKGYYRSNPQVAVGLPVVLGIIVGAGSAILFGSIYGIVGVLSGAVSGLVIIGFGIFMSARTSLGAETREAILGLKRYIDVAEKDRLAFHNAPEKTPERFEKLLPFAMALGVEKAWAKQFEGIYNQNPNWYTGVHHAAFSAAAFSSDIQSFSDSVRSSVASSASHSSSGGFGGGGFSGGGGGGGGGGSW